MAAVDKALTLPYVDPARLGVHGYSYGGYMSAWIIGHDERFGAAVVGAPCINLVSMYGTSDIGVSFGETHWGDAPPSELSPLLERSPLTYASQVSTPVLLLHGETDLRCPIAQSEEYFVRFPGCNHAFLRSGQPRMREEYLRRTLEWFDGYIGTRVTASAEAQLALADD